MIVARKKRELEAVAGHFTWEERDAMQQKLNAIDASGADAAKAITQCALETAAASEMAASTGDVFNGV
jgi:hypothetical protein